MEEEKTKKKDQQSSNILGGVIMVGIGLLFLLVNLDILPSLHKSWPLFMIIIGISLIINSIYAKRNSE